jgi:hypothetical protein
MNWFKQLDELLRGRVTSPERLMLGRIDLSLRRFVIMAAILGAMYGFFMGWYALSIYLGDTTLSPGRWQQALASTVKLPMLFLLTLVVTFPSLYVFNAMIGCRLTFGDTLRLLVAAVTINVAVAASLGTILGFFTLSTTSYPFMVLLNVVLLGIAGVVALAFLLQTLRRLSYPVWPADHAESAHHQARPMSNENGPPEAVSPQAQLPPPDERRWGPLDNPETVRPSAQGLGHARTIFQIWVIIYMLVGVQMGWILRPFIGSPEMPFTWFRPRSGNFFIGVIASIQRLIGLH